MSKSNNMLLGSGDLFIQKFAGTIPEDAVIEAVANRIGGIKGGATLTYTPTIYSVTDDMRRVKKNIVTAEEAIFKSGLLYFELGDLASLTLSGVYTDGTLTVGGQATIQEYIIRFVHTLDNGEKLRVTMVGVPTAGFELAFSTEAESVVNAEFNASPMNEAGNLFKIDIAADKLKTAKK